MSQLLSTHYIVVFPYHTSHLLIPLMFVGSHYSYLPLLWVVSLELWNSILKVTQLEASVTLRRLILIPIVGIEGLMVRLLCIFIEVSGLTLAVLLGVDYSPCFLLEEGLFGAFSGHDSLLVVMYGMELRGWCSSWFILGDNISDCW
jgi:hypothetical protein